LTLGLLPMYLKRLEIAGFKSFANATALEFKPPPDGRFSITAIVGPNGSGKSNIADAIRWVLGEQSFKQLRGKKSDDVIFGGSEGKGKLSAASVTMTLDNSDRRAPVDYEELVITRRVYRTGESEYLVNANPVRLFDLQILLAQAQFGHGSYGIVGQGMIDRLLLQTAAERKSFFDEAVGIKEFQIKRHHAFLKLTRTEEHMAEAGRLLLEVEPHLKSLRRQVKKLEERQAVELALRETQEKYYATQLYILDQELGGRRGELSAIEKKYAASHEELVAVQTELARLAHEASREDQFRVLEDEYQGVMREKNSLEREKSIIAGKLTTEYSRAGKQDMAWLERKLSDLRSELAARRAALAAERESHERRRSERDAAYLALRECEKRKIELQARRTALEKRLFDSRQSEQEIPSGVLRSVGAVLQRRGEFGGAVHGLVAELAAVDDAMKLALEVAAGSHLSSIVVADDRVAEECIRFLKSNQLGVATFLPLTTIRPRPVLADIAGYLSRQGVYGLAVDLVRYAPEFANIFSYVFGSTLVVADIETARAIGIGRIRMVTAEGDLVETSGSLKGGFRSRSPLGLHFVSGAARAELWPSNEDHQQELARLADEERSLDRTAGEKQQAVVAAETAEQTLTHKIELLEAREQETAEEVSRLEAERALSTLDPAAVGAMMEELARTKEALETKLQAAESELSKVQEKMALFNREQEEKRQRVFALQDEMQKTQALLNDHLSGKGAIQMEVVKLETRREDLAAEVFAELKKHADIVRAGAAGFLTGDEIDRARGEIEKLKYKLSLIGGIDEEVMQEYEATRQRHEKLSSELDDLAKASADIRELISELDTIMKKKHATAFAKIKKEFGRYFEILFEGGKAELMETYGDEAEEAPPAEPGGEAPEAAAEPDGERPDGKTKKKPHPILTGIEVSACPPGKKIKNIAALSGGERTLTSIALVCAILHTNPPPFVLLDEVEAALDEANTLRFNKILRELAGESQFVVITHNRVTMHAADILYGVTMGADGVSKLLSVELDQTAAA